MMYEYRDCIWSCNFLFARCFYFLNVPRDLDVFARALAVAKCSPILNTYLHNNSVETDSLITLDWFQLQPVFFSFL